MTETPSPTPEEQLHEPSKPSVSHSRRVVVQTVALMMLLVLLCCGMGIYVLADHNLRSAYSLAATAAEIERVYPGQVNWNDMFQRGVDGMTSILDRYSSYLSADQFGRLDEEFEGEYVGIGVSVIRDPSGLLVMSVRENGPAAQAGLLTGDVIFKIGDTSLIGFDATRSIGLLRGVEGSSVSVTVFRAATSDTLTLKVSRRKLDIVHVAFAGFTPDSMLYLRVLDFEGGASRDIESAIDSLMIEPQRHPRGLILDLRGNPGGLFNEAYQTANLFLEEGRFIVGTESRSRWKVEEVRANAEDITGGLPMAVLVDRGSASAAEIVSGALQKNKRAVLVGDTTFGKGLVQGFTRFSEGDGMRLTISRYFLPGRIYLNEVDSVVHDSGTGLVPDYFIDFIERQPFPIELERSLLLPKFAHAHESEILATDSTLTIDRHLAEQFEQFARDSGFKYVSVETEVASLIADIGRLDQAGTEVVTAAAQLVSIARQRDSALFAEYTAYIETRLRQIAIEHRYGLYQSYARVVVKDRPDIRYAAQILKARP